MRTGPPRVLAPDPVGAAPWGDGPRATDGAPDAGVLSRAAAFEAAATARAASS